MLNLPVLIAAKHISYRVRNVICLYTTYLKGFECNERVVI